MPRPLIYGHRGASAYAPMNTLPAFILAADQGADGIELDVWLSRDGVPVVLHDRAVDSTTNGHGYISEMTLSELQALDAGAWKEARYAGTRIPTLDDVFNTVGRRFTRINVEIKSEPGMVEGVEGAVASCINRHALADRVIVSSFDPLVLQRFRQLAPGITLGFLEFPGTPDAAYGIIKLVPHQARHPFVGQVDAGYMSNAKANGWQVNVWTVNAVEDALRLRDLGVDGIITDTPDVMIAALGAYR